MKNKNQNQLLFIIKSGIIAAIYAVLTMLIPVASYGPVQFRFSEILTLLAFYNPAFVPGLSIGALLSNLGSPYGFLDVFFGTLSSVLALIAMSKVKNLWVAGLMPAIFTPVIVGALIAYFMGHWLAFFPNFLYLFISQFVIVTIAGVIVFKILEEKKFFKDFVNSI